MAYQQKSVQGIPVNEIREAAKHMPEVLLKVRRRNPRGQLAAIPGWSGLRWPTEDLINVEQKVGDALGGGWYGVDCANPMNPMEECPIPSFQFEVEGPPKANGAPATGAQVQGASASPFGAAFAAQSPFGGQVPVPPAAAAAAMQNGGLLPQAPGVSGWMAGAPPSWQWGLFGSGAHDNGAPAASYSSDQMALMQARTLREDNLRYQAEIKELQQQVSQMQADMAALAAEKDAEIRRMQEQNREAVHRLELQMLEKRFEAMAAGNRKESGIAEYVPLIAALAPVMTAMVTSQRESSTKTMEMQMGLQRSMLEAQLKQPKQDWAPLVAAAAPLVMKYMEQRGPESQAAVWDSLMQNNMASLNLIGQFMAQMAQSQGDQSPWIPMLQSALEGGMHTLATYLESQQAKKALPASRPVLTHNGQSQEMPRQPAPQQQPQPQHSVYSPEPQPVEPVQADGRIAIDTASVVRQVKSSPMVPLDFKTPQWLDFVRAVHDQEPIEEVVVRALDHIEHLTETDRLPGLLESIWGSPEECWGRLLVSLPINNLNPPYARQLQLALVAETQRRNDHYAQQAEAEAAAERGGDTVDAEVVEESQEASLSEEQQPEVEAEAEPEVLSLNPLAVVS